MVCVKACSGTGFGLWRRACAVATAERWTCCLALNECGDRHCGVLMQIDPQIASISVRGCRVNRIGTRVTLEGHAKWGRECSSKAPRQQAESLTKRICHLFDPKEVLRKPNAIPVVGIQSINQYFSLPLSRTSVQIYHKCKREHADKK